MLKIFAIAALLFSLLIVKNRAQDAEYGEAEYEEAQDAEYKEALEAEYKEALDIDYGEAQAEKYWETQEADFWKTEDGKVSGVVIGPPVKDEEVIDINDMLGLLNEDQQRLVESLL